MQDTKTLPAAAAFLLLASCAGAPTAQGVEQASPPNVLVIVADDLGFMDVGFENPATFHDTPNLDRLSAQGARFTRGYAACPVCSPTRASLMTGRHPARLDTTDYFGAPQPGPILAAARGERKGYGRFVKLPLIPAPYVNRLVHEEETYAELLQEAGYRTFFAGKWHLGGEGFEPQTQGFEVNVAGHRRGGPYGRGKYFHPFDMPGLESKEGDHLPARLAEETVRFIEENADERWLCTLSFYSVHTPLMGRPDLVERYERKREELGLEAQWGKEGARKVRLVQEHAVYAAMVAAMDEAVGEVLGALDRLGLAEDTLVVFTSDNGGLSTSEGHPTSNLPLRAGKGWLYEGGVREPWVVRWPGQIAAGAVHEVPMQSVDFLPTICAATGVTPRAELDGVDLMPLLRGGAAPEERPLFWHYPHHGNQGGFPGGAVALGDWKWVERYRPDGGADGELYHLGRDPGEADECSADHPEVAARLARMLGAWREEVDAKMPTPNPHLPR